MQGRIQEFAKGGGDPSPSLPVLFDKLDTAKMHGLDTSNVCRVESSRRDVTSQVEFGL